MSENISPALPINQTSFPTQEPSPLDGLVAKDVLNPAPVAGLEDPNLFPEAPERVVMSQGKAVAFEPDADLQAQMESHWEGFTGYDENERMERAANTDAILADLVKQRDAGDVTASLKIDQYNDFAKSKLYKPGENYDRRQSRELANNTRAQVMNHEQLTSEDSEAVFKGIKDRGQEDQLNVLVDSGMERGAAIAMIAQDIILQDIAGVTDEQIHEASQHLPPGVFVSDILASQANALMDPDNVWTPEQIPVKMKEYGAVRSRQLKISDNIGQAIQNSVALGLSPDEIRSKFFEGGKIDGPQGPVQIDDETELNRLVESIYEGGAVQRAQNPEAYALARLVVGTAFKQKGYEQKALGYYENMDDAEAALGEYIYEHPENEKLIGQVIASLTQHHQKTVSGFGNASLSVWEGSLGSTIGALGNSVDHVAVQRATKMVREGTYYGDHGTAEENVAMALRSARGQWLLKPAEDLMNATITGDNVKADGSLIYNTIDVVKGIISSGGSLDVLKGMPDAERDEVLEILTAGRKRNKANMLIRNAVSGATKWEPTDVTLWGFEKTWPGEKMASALETGKEALYIGSQSLGHTAVYMALRNPLLFTVTSNMTAMQNYDRLMAQNPDLDEESAWSLSMTQAVATDASERIGLHVLGKVIPTASLKGKLAQIGAGKFLPNAVVRSLEGGVGQEISGGVLKAGAKAFAGSIAIEGTQEIQQQMGDVVIHELFESINEDIRIDAPQDYKAAMAEIVKNAPMTYLSTALLAGVGASTAMMNQASVRSSAGTMLQQPEQAMAAFGISEEKAIEVSKLPAQERLAAVVREGNSIDLEIRKINMATGNQKVEEKVRKNAEIQKSLHTVEVDKETGRYKILGPGGVELGESYDTLEAAEAVAVGKNAPINEANYTIIEQSEREGQFGAIAEVETAPTQSRVEDPATELAPDLPEQAPAKPAEPTKPEPVKIPTRQELVERGMSPADADLVVRAKTTEARQEIETALEFKKSAEDVLRDAEEIALEINRINPGITTEILATSPTLRDAIKSGLTTLDNATKYVAAKLAQAGNSRDVHDSDFDTELKGISYNDRAHFVGGVVQGAIRLISGKSTARDLWEEKIESHFAAALKLGDAVRDRNKARGYAYIEEAGLGSYTNLMAWTDKELTSELRRIERSTGVRLIKKGEVTRTDILEGVSKLAKAYQTTVYRNSAMSEKMRTALDIIASFISTAVRLGLSLKGDYKLASAVKQLSDEGKLGKKRSAQGISKLETSLKAALGEDVIAGIEQEVYESEQRKLQQDYSKAVDLPTLRDVLAGSRLLPHPSELLGDPLRGEVQKIADRYAQHRRAPKSGKVTKRDYSRNSGIFSRKGEGRQLDDVRRILEQKGFVYDTPAAMLEDIFNNLEGNVDTFATAGFPATFSAEFSDEHLNNYDLFDLGEFWYDQRIQGKTAPVMGNKMETRENFRDGTYGIPDMVALRIRDILYNNKGVSEEDASYQATKEVFTYLDWTPTVTGNFVPAEEAILDVEAVQRVRDATAGRDDFASRGAQDRNQADREANWDEIQNYFMDHQDALFKNYKGKAPGWYVDEVINGEKITTKVSGPDDTGAKGEVAYLGEPGNYRVDFVDGLNKATSSMTAEIFYGKDMQVEDTNDLTEIRKAFEYRQVERFSKVSNESVSKEFQSSGLADVTAQGLPALSGVQESDIYDVQSQALEYLKEINTRLEADPKSLKLRFGTPADAKLIALTLARIDYVHGYSANYRFAGEATTQARRRAGTANRAFVAELEWTPDDLNVILDTGLDVIIEEKTDSLSETELEKVQVKRSLMSRFGSRFEDTEVNPAYDISLNDILAYDFKDSPDYTALAKLEAFIETFESLADAFPTADGHALLDVVSAGLNKGRVGPFVEILKKYTRSGKTGDTKSVRRKPVHTKDTGPHSLLNTIGLGRRAQEGGFSEKAGQYLDEYVLENPNVSKYAVAAHMIQKYSWHTIVRFKKALALRKALTGALESQDSALFNKLALRSGKFLGDYVPETMADVVPGMDKSKAKNQTQAHFNVDRMVSIWESYEGLDSKTVDELLGSVAAQEDTFFEPTFSLGEDVEMAAVEAEETALALKDVDIAKVQALNEVVLKTRASLFRASELIRGIAKNKIVPGSQAAIDLTNARIILHAIKSSIPNLGTREDGIGSENYKNMMEVIDYVSGATQWDASKSETLIHYLGVYMADINRDFQSHASGILTANIHKVIDNVSKKKNNFVFENAFGYTAQNMRRFFDRYSTLPSGYVTKNEGELLDKLRDAAGPREREEINAELDALRVFADFGRQNLTDLVSTLNFVTNIQDESIERIRTAREARISQAEGIAGALKSSLIKDRRDTSTIHSSRLTIVSGVASSASTLSILGNLVGGVGVFGGNKTEVARRKEALKELAHKLVGEETTAKLHQALFRKWLTETRKRTAQRMGMSDASFDVYEEDVFDFEVTRVARKVMIDGKEVDNLHRQEFSQQGNPGIPILAAIRIATREKGYTQEVKKYNLDTFQVQGIRDAFQERQTDETFKSQVEMARKSERQFDGFQNTAIRFEFSFLAYHDSNARETFGHIPKLGKDKTSRLSNGQAQQMLLALKSPENADALTLDGYDTRTMIEIESNMDAAYKDYGYELQSYYANDLGARRISIMERTLGTTRQISEQAWPMKRNADPSINKETSERGDILMSQNAKSNVRTPGSAIDFGFSASKVLERSAMSTIDQDERVTKTLSVLHNVLLDRSVREDLDNISPEFAEIFIKRISEDMAKSKNEELMAEAVEQWWSKARKRASVAILAYRASTVIRQFPAILNGFMSPEDGNFMSMAGHMFTSMLDSDIRKAVFQSESFQARGLAKNFEDTAAGLGGKSVPHRTAFGRSGHKANFYAERVSTFGMDILGKVDTGLNGIAMTAQYSMSFKKAMKANGGDKVAAARAADRAVSYSMAKNAQPFLGLSNTGMHLMSQQNAFFALFNGFKSEVFKHTGLVLVDAHNTLNPSDGRSRVESARDLLMRVFVMGGLNLLMVDLIANLFLSDDELEKRKRQNEGLFLERLMSQSLLDVFSGIPMLGQVLSFVTAKGADGIGVSSRYYTPRSTVVAAFTDGWDQIQKYLEENDVDDEASADDATKAVGKLFNAFGVVSGTFMPAAPLISNLGNVVMVVGQVADRATNTDSPGEKAALIRFRKAAINTEYKDRLAALKGEKTPAGKREYKDLLKEKNHKIAKFVEKNVTEIGGTDEWVEILAALKAKKAITAEQLKMMSYTPDFRKKVLALAKERQEAAEERRAEKARKALEDE